MASARAQHNLARAPHEQPGVPPRVQRDLRRVNNTLPSSKVRWDRKFRVLMVAVVLVVGWVGVHAAFDLVALHTATANEQQVVSKLSQANHALEKRVEQLQQRSTIISSARGLGMIKKGEKPYVVVGH